MARCHSAGFSVDRTWTGMPRLLQAPGPTEDKPSPPDTARGVADGPDPQASQRHPTCHGFVFSGWQCRGEGEAWAASTHGSIFRPPICVYFLLR